MAVPALGPGRAKDSVWAKGARYAPERHVANMTKLRELVASRGSSRSIRTIYARSVGSTVFQILSGLLRVYRKNRARAYSYLLLDAEVNHWRRKKEEVLRLGRQGYLSRIEDIGVSSEQCELVKRAQEESGEVVIAEIDQDGYLLSHFGPIPLAPSVSDEEFLERKKSDLQLVALAGFVGVKKDCRGKKLSFIREVNALHSLGLAGCNVPAIMDVDFDNVTLTFSYIAGAVLREELAKRGAVVRDRDVDAHPAFAQLGRRESWLKRIHEGTRVLYDVIGVEFIESLFDELKKVHASRFIWGDVKYGNVIIEAKTGKPYLVDFDRAEHYPRLPSSLFQILRDQEVDAFNLHFATAKPTSGRTGRDVSARTTTSILV